MPSEPLLVSIDTPEGPGRFHVSMPAPDVALWAVLVLGHGAGGGVDAVDLSVLARRLPEHGVAVLRFEQPWRVAGQKVAVRPPRLDVAWTSALTQLVGTGTASVEESMLPADLPVFVGGRSAGARVACRTSAEPPLAARVAGVVACAFPLHLPGKPEASRAPELLAPRRPVLVLQGERDSFGGHDEVLEVLTEAHRHGGQRQAFTVDATSDDADEPRGDVTLVRVPGADHSMRVPARGPISAADVRDLITEQTLAFCARVTQASRGRDGEGQDDETVPV